MNTVPSNFAAAGTDLRFKQGLVLAMLEEANRAVLVAAGYVVGPSAQLSPPPISSNNEAHSHPEVVSQD